jgi:polyhydroxybutyrate depolymerase
MIQQAYVTFPHTEEPSMHLALGLFLILGMVCAGWSVSMPKYGVPAPGTYRRKTDLRVGGFRRTYLLRVPEGYDGTVPLPMVVLIHGAFSSAQTLERQSGFSGLADREDFVAVYPNGIGLFGLLRHWNSGHCCGKARKDNIDDVGFVMSVIEEVSEQLYVDRRRVYLVGHSNGGMLAYRIAAERAGMVAAIAPVSATIGGRPSADEPEWMIPEPEAPVPMVILHGRADQHVPYDGGRGERSRGRSSTISVPRSVAFWVEQNGCTPNPRSDRYLKDRVVREVWDSCTDSADIVLYTLEGWGHVWPGPPFTNRLRADDPLRGFDAAEIIWDFLKRHRRRAPSPNQ